MSIPFCCGFLFLFFKKISDLEIKCRHHENERNLAQHNASVAAKQLEEVKQEIKEKEKLFHYHNSSLGGASLGNDTEKLKKMIKQLEFSNDLTKQKLEKIEKQSKEFEIENRRLQGADVRIFCLEKEKSSLLTQLDGKQAQQQEKDKIIHELSIEKNRLQVHVDKLSAEARKSKNQLEKKNQKIDELEQTLSKNQDCVMIFFFLLYKCIFDFRYSKVSLLCCLLFVARVFDVTTDNYFAVSSGKYQITRFFLL